MVKTSTATDGGTYDLLAADGVINDAANSFTMGEGVGGSNDGNGYVCNAGYWVGKGLSHAEIKSIMWKQYADLTTTEKISLVSWWNLDVETNTSGESGTGGVKDHHGSNHGTLL